MSKKWMIVWAVTVLVLLIGNFFFPRPVDTISRTEYQQSQEKLKAELRVELKAELNRQLAESSANQTASINKRLADIADNVTAVRQEFSNGYNLEELNKRLADIADNVTAVRQEFFKGLEDVIKRLSNTPPYPSASYGSQFKAEVYSDEDFTRYIDTFQESDINHDWGNGGPSGMRDHFSVRWESVYPGHFFEGGNYLFKVAADDGVRLYIDGYLVLDKWLTHAVTTYQVEYFLTQGRHTIRLDYFEREGKAVVRLNWQKSEY